MSRRVAVALAVASAVGCAQEDQAVVQVRASGGIAEFATYVQPVLEQSCASLDCHGNTGRFLRLYARDGLRTDAALRGEDCTDGELTANMRAIDGLTPESVPIEDRLILIKPLSHDAGGVHHVGGELWANQNDPGYRCLHAWLRAGASDEAGQAICGRAVP